METHDLCLEELKVYNLIRKENDWCFERYNCPKFTTPDEYGNVREFRINLIIENFSIDSHIV